MIKVNGKTISNHEGATVLSLLKLLENDNRFSYMLNFKGMISYNGQIIDEKTYESTIIFDGDELMIMPLIVGG